MGSAASAAGWAPGSTTTAAPVPNRAIACAAPGVSAMAARAAKPLPTRRPSRSYPATPPRRRTDARQPAMSSHSPSGGSAAVSGE